MTWQEICDKGLAGRFSILKGVPLDVLFSNLDGKAIVCLDIFERIILALMKKVK